MTNAHRNELRAIAEDPEKYKTFVQQIKSGEAKITVESQVYLMTLHKMFVTQQQISTMGSDLKAGHQKVQWLHKLQQMIQKCTSQKEETRGQLDLATEAPDHKYHKLVEKYDAAFRTYIKQDPGPVADATYIDLKDPEQPLGQELLTWIEKENIPYKNSAYGIGPVLEKYWSVDPNVTALAKLLESKTLFKGTDEINQLLDALHGLEGIDNLSSRIELKKQLKVAEKDYDIKFAWPQEGKPFDREEREALMTAIETTCKDLQLANDMKMHDLNRAYQEHLEVIQMARNIQKTLHDDKVHKARSAGGR